MIQRVLIANRGEIARRVIRTCRHMGIATVAVHSDADADAPHVREADAHVAIGPALASESYLNIPRLVEAARTMGADAVHPGYGFLSENASFAEACEAAGLIFIGPPASVMRRMGSKPGARQAMQAAGVPVVPGITPGTQRDDDIAAAVWMIGLPALLKASAGGGGKGMRDVRRVEDIEDAIGAVRREALRAFGNGSMYVERLVERPRHIEVQIFADAHGNVVHLRERDCSLQRRHQKVIEEAPAPNLSPGVRDRLLAAAITAARAVGYVNAGTVEFLLEGEGDDAQFYFLEMNMRLQVEHPVTEAITGLDLVRAQLLVASGEPLPFAQDDIVLQGHAIECRVYAEDARTLLPQSGALLRYREPSGDGIRVDAGVVEGQTITVHYDPLIAKLIASGPTREVARTRLMDALGRYEILGLRHNLSFLSTLLQRPEVVASTTYTKFIEDHFAELTPEPGDELRQAAAAAAAWQFVEGLALGEAEGEADVAARRRPGQAGGALGDSVTDDAVARARARAAAHDPWDALGPLTW
jgi:acetyl/propionyl-CoA carboxylase alpha subunit